MLVMQLTILARESSRACAHIPNTPIDSDLAIRFAFRKEPVRSRLERLQTPIERTRIDSLYWGIDTAQMLR
jgi:hypothetical protein